MNSTTTLNKLALALAAALMLTTACSTDDDNNSTDTPETETSANDEQQTVDQQPVFDYASATKGGTTLPYRRADIARTADDRPALVVYLHGGTSRGDDNERQLDEPATSSLASYLARNSIAAMLVVPQCPAGEGWKGPLLTVVRQIIDDCVDQGANPSRIYLLGGSMGGTGTWSMLNAYPGLFAAAMPVAGSTSDCDPVDVAQTPVLTVMGTADRIMSMAAAAEFVDALEHYGGTARLDIEDGWTHEMVCQDSYTDERLAWVLRHTK